MQIPGLDDSEASGKKSSRSKASSKTDQVSKGQTSPPSEQLQESKRQIASLTSEVKRLEDLLQTNQTDLDRLQGVLRECEAAKQRAEEEARTKITQAEQAAVLEREVAAVRAEVEERSALLHAERARADRAEKHAQRLQQTLDEAQQRLMDAERESKRSPARSAAASAGPGEAASAELSVAELQVGGVRGLSLSLSLSLT